MGSEGRLDGGEDVQAQAHELACGLGSLCVYKIDNAAGKNIQSLTQDTGR